MKVNRAAALIVFYATMVLIPLLLLLRILFGHAGSQAMFWAEAAVCALYFMLVFRIGYWGFVGYALRYILPVLFIAATGFGYLRTGMALPLWNTQLSAAKAIFLVAATAVLTIFIKKSSAAKAYHGVPIRLSFPFRHGKYYILEGGDSKKCRLMNYHFAGAAHTKNRVNKSMRFATDIVKLKRGIFCRGLLPRTTEDYYIAGESLYCPCDGIVVETLDELDNEIPFSGKHPYNVGNRIVIEKDGINVLMGHLQKGSIKVKAGDKVLEGQVLAAVGNSGLTEFPHLHIQAMRENEESMWSGEGVPILFDYKFLVKNTMKRQK
jgi:hypothetical protein